MSRIASTIFVLSLIGGQAVAPLRHRAVTHPSTTQAPAAVADTFQTSAGTPLAVAAPGVLANDTLNGAAIISYGASSGSEQTSVGAATPTAGGGTINLNSDGSFLYTPAAAFLGADTFKYVLRNSIGTSAATVTITVIAPAPVAVADSFSTRQGISLDIAAPGVLANDTLNGGTIVSYGPLTGAEQTSIGAATPTARAGSVSLNADGSFHYSPQSSFTGSDAFSYILQNSGGSSMATVTITVTVPAPSAVADSYTTQKGTTLNVPASGVLANDTLNGATIASYGALTGNEQTSIGAATATARGGTVSLNANGSFAYVPPSNFSGNDTFVYVLRNAGGSASATVTIAVQAPAGADFTVTSPGFFYSISGLSGQNPVITLTRGRTYTFQISTSSIHPFEILDAPAGSVTNNNISSGTITFAVPMAAQNYQYICSIHGFGNTIQTVP